MKPFPEFLNTGEQIGPETEYRPGTPEYASSLSIKLWSLWSNMESAAEFLTVTQNKWRRLAERFEREKLYTVLGFDSFNDFVCELTRPPEPRPIIEFQTNTTDKRKRTRRK